MDCPSEGFVAVGSNACVVAMPVPVAGEVLIYDEFELYTTVPGSDMASKDSCAINLTAKSGTSSICSFGPQLYALIPLETISGLVPVYPQVSSLTSSKAPNTSVSSAPSSA